MKSEVRREWVIDALRRCGALTAMSRAAVAIVIGFGGACGGGGSPAGPGPTPPGPPAGAFAGNYSTRVTLTSSGCGAVTVQDNPTSVTHNETTGAIVLTHVGISYSGAVVADSTFSTPVRLVDVGDGFQYSIAIAGRFHPGAFDADATVDKTSTANVTCRFVVHWAGTK